MDRPIPSHLLYRELRQSWGKQKTSSHRLDSKVRQKIGTVTGKIENTVDGVWVREKIYTVEG